MFNAVIKDRPWGYQNSKQLFEEYIKSRFEKLNDAEDYGAYYDFLGGVGLFRNWNYALDKSTVPKYIETAYQMWNNIKHFTLDERTRKFYVSNENLTIFLNYDGNNVFTDKGKWEDKKLRKWTDNTEVDNKSGKQPGKVQICDSKKVPIENLYLYEFCKRAYKEMEEAFYE